MSSAASSNNFSNRTGNFLGNMTNIQRNVSTPNLTADLFNNGGQYSEMLIFKIILCIIDCLNERMNE